MAKQDVEYLRIKKGPAPEIVAEDGKAKTLPAGYIHRRLRLGYPTLENILIGDKHYLYTTEKGFHDLIDWTKEFIAQKVPSLSKLESYPISYRETFISLASNFANIAVARRYNLRASVLIGGLTAKNVKPWGQIPGDGKIGVYMIGLTNDYMIIYDIYTGQSTKAAEFPNLATVKGIMF